MTGVGKKVASHTFEDRELGLEVSSSSRVPA
jgi:hypothetical protein